MSSLSRTYPNLISIDGPDGSGKSSLSRYFVKMLSDLYRKKTVRVIKPSYFETSREAQNLGRRLKAKEGLLIRNSAEHNQFFLRAMRVNFLRVVLPLLESGVLVVLDSSEIRALAFVCHMGDSMAKEQTQRAITHGWLTAQCVPSLRVVLSGNALDLWQNLQTKESLDYGDPQSVDQVVVRQTVYLEAVNYVRALKGAGESKWLELTVSHINKFHGDLSDYFLCLATSVLNQYKELKQHA